MRLLGTFLWVVGGALAAVGTIVVGVFLAGGEVESADAAVAGGTALVGVAAAVVGVRL